MYRVLGQVDGVELSCTRVGRGGMATPMARPSSASFSGDIWTVTPAWTSVTWNVPHGQRAMRTPSVLRPSSCADHTRAWSTSSTFYTKAGTDDVCSTSLSSARTRSVCPRRHQEQAPDLDLDDLLAADKRRRELSPRSTCGGPRKIRDRASTELRRRRRKSGPSSLRRASRSRSGPTSSRARADAR